MTGDIAIIGKKQLILFNLIPVRNTVLLPSFAPKNVTYQNNQSSARWKVSTFSYLISSLMFGIILGWNRLAQFAVCSLVSGGKGG